MQCKKEELKEITTKVGNLIKTRRDKLGLTVAKLSEISGISTAVITDLETGKNKIPNLLSFVCLAEQLGLEDEFTQLIFPPKISPKDKKESKSKKIEMFLLDYISPSLAQSFAETIYLLGCIEKFRNQSGDKKASITIEDVTNEMQIINRLK
jgi:transcriptional regulator with XRE-family HTH domain